MIITEQDFDQLTTNSMKWGPDWATQMDRFEDTIGVLDFEPAMAYWADTYSAVLWCIQFLASMDEQFTVAWDTATEDYLIVTHYMTASWRND
ncbi:MAG: hypothetical protein EBQ97_02850 [Bacteroidetes bacterium]|nr:hypothetical protein [Bacteroidota bacterium]